MPPYVCTEAFAFFTFDTIPLMSELNQNEKSDTLEPTPIKELEPKPIKVWDLPVRIFHWLLVVVFIAAYVTNSLGPNYFQYHVWTGYAVIVLICFRIVWGIFGTYHARFINFVRNPIATLKYAWATLRNKERHYAGHNPLGAMMVLLLLLTILVQAVTGLFTNDEIFNVGPLYVYVTDELSLKLTSFHRQLFYWILGTIFLHIIAVFVHLFFKKENLVKPMISGEKPAKGLEDEKSIGASKIWLALFIIVVLAALLGWVITTAPEAVVNTDY